MKLISSFFFIVGYIAFLTFGAILSIMVLLTGAKYDY